MRRFERTLRWFYIAAALPEIDTLGGASRGFSAARIPVRAGVAPAQGEWRSDEAGLADGRRCQLILPPDAPIAPGDGVAEAVNAPVRWLCRDVRRWPAHAVADLERMIEQVSAP